MDQAGIIRDLLIWLEGHLDQPLSLDNVAAKAGYSKWHLQRMFKDVTGHAIGAYIRARRLSKSAVALRLTVRPSQDKDDEQEVFYTTALAQDQADGYVLTGHPVMLQGGEYVMFTYEGLGTGVQEFILTVYGTCMPMLNLTRRKGQDIERYYPAEDAKAGDRPINLRCELLIPIRR
ncbi:TPA: GyrI-like domain-containing protein [Escherichia coli]|nr:GyrI-like domain-containing protein [Escherichia coli]